MPDIAFWGSNTPPCSFSRSPPPPLYISYLRHPIPTPHSPMCCSVPICIKNYNYILTCNPQGEPNLEDRHWLTALPHCRHEYPYPDGAGTSGKRQQRSTASFKSCAENQTIEHHQNKARRGRAKIKKQSISWGHDLMGNGQGNSLAQSEFLEPKINNKFGCKILQHRSL